MKHTILSAVDRLLPDEDYELAEPYEYENLIFYNPSVTKPTKEAIENKIAEVDAAEAMLLLREERNDRLIETDWTQMNDISSETKAKWSAYRQALRDMPATASPQLDAGHQLDMTSVTWPTKPS